ncbi:type II toxin-antitoxin system RelE/ParE family toxin, partial [archaeon]|nr:type II toxin-antitoxin system RelE/ParE family toxin [archaeon]
MVVVEFLPTFEKRIKNIKDNVQKKKLKKLIAKIIQNPEIGKPIRYGRKGTREVYMKPFRISYSFERSKLIIFF